MKDLGEIVQKEIDDVKSSLDEKVSENQVIDIIANNNFKIEFEEVIYKLKKPNTSEISEMYTETAKRKTDLLMNSSLLPAVVLKAKWLEKGVDIDGIEIKIKNLVEEKEKFQFSLGKLLESKAEEKEVDEKDLKKYKKQIEDIDTKIGSFNAQINACFDMSIENNLGMFQYMYLAYLISRKIVDDKEIKAFDTYDDYLQAPAILTNKLNVYTVLMARDVISGI